MTSRRINITIDETLHDQAINHCKEKGLSFSGFVSELIIEKIAQNATRHYMASPEFKEYVGSIVQEYIASLTLEDLKKLNEMKKSN
jgi:hypothetical protein